MKPTETKNETETLFLHAFNQFSYCEHRYWMMYGCGEMLCNQHVFRGLRAHRRADRGGPRPPSESFQTRSVKVRHRSLGLSGVIDLVEKGESGESIPIEIKAGKCRGDDPWPNDLLQVAAQALCLEDMFGKPASEAMIYYAGSRKRIRVKIDEAIREKVEQSCIDMREILSHRKKTTPLYSRRCEGCSLFDLCLPLANEYLKNLGEDLENDDHQKLNEETF